MTKIKNSFANGKAFIPFITCGDPSLAISEQLVYAMEAAGVLDGNEILIVQVVPRPQHPDDSAKLGERLPVNISAMGKCLTLEKMRCHSLVSIVGPVMRFVKKTC